jgi:hypothetical protein
MMHDDWNPHAQRRRKKNRVSRGIPERPRRYYFKPIAGAIALIFFWQAGVTPAILRAVGHKARDGYAWLSTPNKQDAELKRNIQKARALVATAQIMLDRIEKLRAEREAEQTRIALDEAAKSPDAKTITIYESGHLIFEPGVVTAGASGNVMLGDATGSNWTVHPPDAQPSPRRRQQE